MQITRSLRRTVAATVLAAGLAYPACAAVCPKGIGGCTSPGRCFLFVDADGNSLCDYTGRTGSAATGYPSQPGSPATPAATPAPSSPASSPQAAVTGSPSPEVSSAVPQDAVQGSSVQAGVPASSPDTAMAIVQGTSSGTPSVFPFPVLFTGIALFIIFTGLIFALVRSGRAGIRVEKPLPALVLSGLYGLCLSLVATSLVSGSTVPGTTYALVLMGAGTPLAAYLWYAGVMTRKTVTVAAVLATLAGFVFLAPIMPLELGGIVNVITGASAATYGIIVICSVIALALVTGRVFCGTLCPVGMLQELAYAVPVPKILVRRTEVLEGIRLAVFVAAAIAAVYLIDIMEFTGLYDFFALALSAGFVVAAGLFVLSAFVYRPVCRVLCPFGVLFSLASEFSLLRLQRTASCTGCRRCEAACPARTAGAADSKRECYLCGRCTDACRVAGALTYRR